MNEYNLNETMIVEDTRLEHIIEIPSIQLKLPLFNECNKQTLNNGCALYYKDDEQMIICGHNTSSVFKKIRQLKQGDIIYVDDLLYKVEKDEIIKETSIKEMKESSYDLSLFTCTNDSRHRYVVRCTYINNN